MRLIGYDSTQSFSAVSDCIQVHTVAQKNQSDRLHLVFSKLTWFQIIIEAGSPM